MISMRRKSWGIPGDGKRYSNLQSPPTDCYQGQDDRVLHPDHAGLGGWGQTWNQHPGCSFQSFNISSLYSFLLLSLSPLPSSEIGDSGSYLQVAGLDGPVGCVLHHPGQVQGVSWAVLLPLHHGEGGGEDARGEEEGAAAAVPNSSYNYLLRSSDAPVFSIQ